MKILNSMAFSFVRFLLPVGMALLISSCSEEKSEPLPELPPVELPKDVTGLYSGSIPCDDCTMKALRITLNEDSTVNAVQTRVTDSMQVDSLKGVFSVVDSSIRIVLPSASESADSVHWNFKRSASGNLVYMNSAGQFYEDENGRRAELFRIMTAPVQKSKDPK